MAKFSKNANRLPRSDEPNELLLCRAHERLDQLWTEAARGDFTGEVGIKAIFERGTAKILRRHLEGTDK